MKQQIRSIQSRLSRDELEREFRACVAFSAVMGVALYALLSIGGM